MKTETVTPRIYVACLASYNQGELFGEWIDATLSVDRIRDAISNMLHRSRIPGAEEWAIHDYEGFGCLKLSEYEGIDNVAALAEAIDKHGEVYALYADHVGSDYASPEDFQEKYQGEFRSLEEWAAQFLDETGAFHGVPELLKNYFNFESYARDAQYSGDIFATEDAGNVHVFWNS